MPARSRSAAPVLRSPAGFTLLELIVVLMLMALATTLVAPAVLRPMRDAESDIARLVRDARTTAMRRSEMVLLEITPDGAWRLDGASSLRDGPLATGTVDGWSGPGGALVVSPLGSCGVDPDRPGLERLDLDPLTCQVRSP